MKAPVVDRPAPEEAAPPRPVPETPVPEKTVAARPTTAVVANAEALWRARALRYTLLYLLLAGALVGLRYQGRDVYPELRAQRDQKAALQQRRSMLELDIERASSAARVRAWALSQGMLPFSQARKQTAAFTALPSPPALPPSQSLKVNTAWK